MALRTIIETLLANPRRDKQRQNVQPGTEQLAVSHTFGQKSRGPTWVGPVEVVEVAPDYGPLIGGVLGAGGGVVVGLLAGPKLGMSKGLGALVGGGAGLLAALLIVRWT